MTSEGLSLQVLEDVSHPVSEVRLAASQALASLLALDTEQLGPVLTLLLDTYQEKLEMIPPVVDHLGRVIQVFCQLTDVLESKI